MAWTVEVLNETVEGELNGLAADLRARFSKVSELIEAVGLEQVHEPHVKHLKGALWEIRVKGKDNIARAIYVTAHRQRVVVVRVFVKTTRKTPRREIELALRRAQEVT